MNDLFENRNVPKQTHADSIQINNDYTSLTFVVFS